MSENQLSPEVKQEITEVSNEALELAVIDNDSYARAGELLVLNSGLKKKIEAFFKPLKQAQDKAKKVILDAEKAEIAKITPNIEHLNMNMTVWNLKQEKIRKAEEDRLRREAEAKAEEEQLQAAIEAEAQGNSNEAEEIMEEPVFVPPPVVEKSVPKVAGQTMSTNWKWKLKDINKLPRQYMIPDEVALNALVRAQKERTNIPGIEVYPENKMRGVRQ